MKFSDLDIDIPSLSSENIRHGICKAKVSVDGTFRPHPAGVYFYSKIPCYEEYAILDYKDMEKRGYQKIDFLNNHVLDNLSNADMTRYLSKIETEEIDWVSLKKFEEPYQLAKYPNILKEFDVSSVLDIAIVLALIRPGALSNYDKMKKNMHTDNILSKLPEKKHAILKDTYGIPVFEEQFRKLGISNDKYRYKKPHAIGYAYVLLLDFLKKTSKK